MVSAKLLLEPVLRRCISFGSSYCSNYRYEKLESEHEQGSNESIISSINSFDSFLETKECDGGEKCRSSRDRVQLERDAPPAGDSTTIRNSISSVLFSVGESTWSDGCSYSYSLCSDSFPIKTSSPFVKWEEDVGTFDTSDYSNSTFELNFMSRHAGLDYGGRTPPKAPCPAVITPNKAVVASPRELRHKSPRHDDEDVLEGARIVKKQLSMSIITPDCPQLEKTLFDSSLADEDFADEDLLPTPTKLSPRSVMHVDKGHRVQKWLSKNKPSSDIRSMNSPAA